MSGEQILCKTKDFTVTVGPEGWQRHIVECPQATADQEAEQRAREKAEQAVQEQMMLHEWYLRWQIIQHNQMIMCQGIFFAQSPQPQIAQEGYCIDCGGATNPNPKHPQGKYHIRCTECFNCHMGY